MGEVGGFLKHRRIDPGYREIAERLRDFKSVELRLDRDELVRQAARCMDCGIPFCHGHGCPLGNLIPEFNDLLYHGRWQAALDILVSTNNFPEFTGRICPQLCEESCVLNLNDDPVTIRQIELALVELGFLEGYLRPNPPARRLAGKVAVVGSGPAGLTVADTLNKLGYPVTVYDAAARPGGILRYGIPDFKMEKWIVERRIDLMQAEGVQFENHVMVGDDLSYHYLQSRYTAVCLCGGAQQPRDLPVPGRDLPGTHFAMEYLVQQNRILAAEPVAPAALISAAGKKVVILGGGDTGSDCLGTALRQGALKVVQLEILPQPPLKRTVDMPWPEWPGILRQSSSHKEGGQTIWGATVKEIHGNGKVEKLLCTKVEWNKTEKGFRMQELPGSEFEIEADLVLLAMGFTGPGINRLVADWGIEPDSRGFVKRNASYATSLPEVFAAGDMVSGPSLVVRAIADARQAALSIAAFLRTKE